MLPKTTTRRTAPSPLPDPWRTFRQERREALVSVLEDFRRRPDDPNAAAANAALLRHLLRFPAAGRVS